MELKATEIKKIYGRGLLQEKNPVLNGASLTVSTGDWVGLVGMSGCGKSTLAQIMSGMLSQDSGELSLNGRAIRRPFDPEARRHIQLVFQHPEIALSPRMQIAAGFRETYRLIGERFSEERLLEHLRFFGLYREHLYRLPETLSGGELQRLCLARILLLEPRFLILDEPTSMLDTISQAQVIRSLQEIREKRDIGYLFITHDRELAGKICDRIYAMKDGKTVSIT